MVMETIDKVISNLGAADIDARLEELLVDGILYAFQEQVGAQIAAPLAHLFTDSLTGADAWDASTCVGDMLAASHSFAAEIN